MSIPKLDTGCPYCGEAHKWERCERIAAIEYFGDGSKHRVEFKQDPVFEFELDDTPEDE